MTAVIVYNKICPVIKFHYLCCTYSPNRYRTTTLDTMGWFINCLIRQGITTCVPALLRQ